MLIAYLARSRQVATPTSRATDMKVHFGLDRNIRTQCYEKAPSETLPSARKSLFDRQAISEAIKSELGMGGPYQESHPLQPGQQLNIAKHWRPICDLDQLATNETM